MSEFTLLKSSSSFENEVHEKALQIFISGKSEGIMFGQTSIYIYRKPAFAISVYAGQGLLAGKKIYVGHD